MSDVTQSAAGCHACAAVTVPPSDPAEILGRLPAALFNQRRPVKPGGAEFDNIFFDETQYGPIGGEEPTPQWELARLFARERDELVTAWRQMVAAQHGLGLMRVEGGEVVSECPHATGRDLDRVGEQFGVGRPSGFTDCCYWRLVSLLVWKPGTTAWLVREVAELFTGIRPTLTEAPAKLFLTWPALSGTSFFGPRTTDTDPGGWFYGRDSYLVSGADFAVAPGAWHGFWLHGDHDNTPPAPVTRNSFWGTDQGQFAQGLDLHTAIDLVKAAGIAVAYVNEPPAGLAGCYGATLRTAPTGVVWA